MGVKSRIKSCFKIFQKEVKTPVYIPVFSGDILSGKTALITGGAGGIGKAIAEACLKNGASVILTGRDTKKLLRVISSLEKERIVKKQKVIPLLLDIQNINSIKPSIYKVIKENSIDKIDILVNNAGISARESIYEYKPEDFARIMNLNVNAVFYFIRAVVPYMKEQGSGSIINTSSVVSIRGQAAGCGYPTSKFAVNGLTISLARELGRDQIRVNAVAPGVTRTDMVAALPEEMVKRISAGIPLNRVGEPDEVADTFLFLASDMASYVTGEILSVDGATIP